MIKILHTIFPVNQISLFSLMLDVTQLTLTIFRPTVKASRFASLILNRYMTRKAQFCTKAPILFVTGLAIIQPFKGGVRLTQVTRRQLGHCGTWHYQERNDNKSHNPHQ
ncbi:MAG: hypothetical protein AAB305_03235 [Candidatus Zixiibacteriota bacterium]